MSETQQTHPRRKDPAERVASRASGPDVPLTEHTEASAAHARSVAALDGRLDAIERRAYDAASPADIAAAQAEGIREVLESWEIKDAAIAEWATRKLAETDNELEDFKAAYEAVKAEWETRIRAAKRRHEIREGLFKGPLAVYSERELKLPPPDVRLALPETHRKKIKLSHIVGPRRLAFRDYEPSVKIADRDRIIAAIREEDPFNEQGRLRQEWTVMDLDAEKARALEAAKANGGDIPAGWEYTPTRREFYVQHPKAKE